MLARKPDGVERALVGEVIRRFEAKGLRIVLTGREDVPPPY